MLRSLVLAGHDDAGREVSEPNGGIGDVDVLAARAARSIGVDPQVLVVDVDVDVLGQLGPDVHRREGGMAPGGLIERRNAHEPMNAGFGRQQSVRVLPGDGEGDALQPGLVARLVVDDLALEPAALHPSQIHAQEHLGPILRFGTAGARVNGDNRVLAIVLTAEHLLDLAGLHLPIERFDRLPELGIDDLARVGPFEQDGKVVALLPERQRSDRGPAPAAGAAAGPSGPRPGPSRNQARRRASPGGSAPLRVWRLQRKLRRSAARLLRSS